MSSPMPPRLLAEVFSRLAVSSGAGIDPLKAWRSEAQRVPPRWRRPVEQVAKALAAGEPIEQALAAAGGAFAPELRAIVAAADRSGRDTDVYREIATSSRVVARARSRMWQGLAWPAFQLVLAAAVCGLLILVSGGTVDLLGVGLVGRKGFAIYFVGLAVVFCGIVGVGILARASWNRRGVARRVAAAIPVVGGTLAAWEHSAWCRAAGLAASVGLDVGRIVRLAGDAAPGLSCDERAVVSSLAAGDTLATALVRQGIFQTPTGRRVLVALDVGEQSGSTAETLGSLGEQLLEEAAGGLQAIAGWAGHAVWATVAVLAALLIVRVVGSYANLLQGLAR